MGSTRVMAPDSPRHGSLSGTAGPGNAGFAGSQFAPSALPDSATYSHPFGACAMPRGLTNPDATTVGTSAASNPVPTNGNCGQSAATKPVNANDNRF